MYILALETTGPHASVALIDDRGHTKELVNDGTLNHLENLAPMIEECLGMEGITLRDISYIACSQGPGSFTGIRIGVTTARGLAQVLNCDVIPVETLRSFAYAAVDYYGLICPVIDARRNQCYAAGYSWKRGNLEEVIPPGPYMIDDFLEKVQKTRRNCLFFGDGIRRYGEKIYGIKNDVETAGESNMLQRAGLVAMAALDGYMNGDMVPYGQLEPIYMRKAEAERKREERLKNESADN